MVKPNAVFVVFIGRHAEHCLRREMFMSGSIYIHLSVAELKEQIGVCSRSVFGMEPSQMSFLFFLMYVAAAGGLLALLESTPGCAQEFKIKVSYSYNSPESILLNQVPFQNWTCWTKDMVDSFFTSV